MSFAVQLLLASGVIVGLALAWLLERTLRRWLP